MKGFRNLGLTCYFSAALQCLAYCPNLANYFLSGMAAGDLNPAQKGGSALAQALSELVCVYWTQGAVGDVVDVDPVYRAFTRSCRAFCVKQQHDCHEALVFLLDKLHAGLSKMKPVNAVATLPGVQSKAWSGAWKGASSVVTEVFCGQVETRVVAGDYTSVSHDHFTCLSLAVDSSASLMQCFHRHMTPEVLTDFKVEGRETDARVQKRFTHLPRILVVHLKRFDTQKIDRFVKIDRFIDYPTELNLDPFAARGSPHHYQLFAVCLHRGTAADGHYVVCGEVKGRWYTMDDEVVADLKNINDIIQRDAYILLYKRL